MADHAKPILTDNYTDVLSQIRGRFEDQAKGFDPASTTATNIVTGTIRWNSAENKFQKWSGTTWGDLTTNYALAGATFSNGTPGGVMYLNGSRVVTTGGALRFDGSTLTVGSVGDGGKLSLSGPATFAGNGFSLYEDSTGSTRRLRVHQDADSVIYNATFGTGGNQHVWQIGNTEQMRLTSTGLGIGTSSPAYKLDVNGTGRIGTAIFDASGNLGLAQVPSLWGSSYRALQVLGSSFSRNDALDARLNIGNNVYFDSSSQPRYIASATASYYRQGFTLSEHAWFIAPSGTAGNPITFTQAMTLNASGNLLVGNTNGTSRITATGVIESTTGGFKFPDGTTQTTATRVSSLAYIWNGSMNAVGTSFTHIPLSAPDINRGGNFVAGAPGSGGSVFLVPRTGVLKVVVSSFSYTVSSGAPSGAQVRVAVNGNIQPAVFTVNSTTATVNMTHYQNVTQGQSISIRAAATGAGGSAVNVWLEGISFEMIDLI